MRSRWAQADLNRSQIFDLARVILWAVLTPTAYMLGWLNSVAFVSLLSIWALVETAWAAYRATEEKRLARIESKLDRLLEND
jgi:hypothetical protein